MESFKLNSRVSSSQREYLIQTVNDEHNQCIRSAIFSEGILLETLDEEFSARLPQAELLELVKTTHRERKEEIEQLFEQYAEALSSEDVDQIGYLGQALMFRNMFDEAENLFQRAIELNPESHEAYNSLGCVLLLKDQYDEAIKLFSKAVELQPYFADYHNNLGEAFLAISSCKRAMIEFDESIKLNLYYGDAYYNKALTFVLNAIRREDFDLFSEYAEKTAEMFERAIVICPEFQGRDFEEGKKLLQNGDLEGAYKKLLRARYKKQTERNRKFSAIYIKYLISSNKLDEKLLTGRIKSLKAELVKNPHYCDLHYELAVAYTLLGRFVHSKAIDQYKKALKINPDFERAKKSLKLAENEFRGFEALVKVISKG